MNILIGNGISTFAGIFLILSCYVNDEYDAYKYQCLEAFTLTISSIFFLSWTGVTTMALAGIRNYIVMKGKYTLKLAVIFTFITIILGLLVNTMGIVGLLPVIAMVQITLCNYFFKSIKFIKIAFIVNVLFYVVYFIVILDFVSAIVQIITALIGLISLIRLIKQENNINELN